jgi:hypothetical protein
MERDASILLERHSNERILRHVNLDGSFVTTWFDGSFNPHGIRPNPNVEGVGSRDGEVRGHGGFFVHFAAIDGYDHGVPLEAVMQSDMKWMHITPSAGGLARWMATGQPADRNH